MNDSKAAFDIKAYLASTGPGRRFIKISEGGAFFSQGDTADRVFYLYKGRVRISAVSRAGKEATIRLVSGGSFVGEKAMEETPGVRLTSATAMTDCTALQISRAEFIRVMHEESSFLYLFSSFLLACTMRTQADLVDQLFNPAEKRLARILLLLVESDQSKGECGLIPPISQEALASMIGTTRPRVSSFMNRFRKLGYIEYDERIRVHKSMLNLFLRD